jgi:hypothetical protein
MVRKAFALMVIFAVAGCAAGTRKYTPEMVQHFNGSVFKATETGYYTAELILRPNPPVVGKNRADLIIHDYRAHDIPGLDITVTPYLVEGNEASPESPAVKDEGRGLYLIENLHYQRPGKFALRVEIKGPKDDTVVLPLPEVKAAE